MTRVAQTASGMHLYQKIFELSPDAYVVIDAAGRIAQVNTQAERLFGYLPGELVGQPVEILIPERLAPKHREHRARFMNEPWVRRMGAGATLEGRRKDGTQIPVEISLSPLATEDGLFAISCIRDVSARRQAEEQLVLAASVFESTNEAIIITDWARTIVSVNRAFTESAGFGAEEVLGRHISMLDSAQHAPAAHKAIWQQIDASGRWRGEVWRRRKNGESYPTLTGISAVKNRDGAITHYIDVSHDITQHKRAEEHIWKLAHFDPLTGVSNRVHLQERARQALAAAQREGTKLALVLIDLDRFKNINDSLGHVIGDRLLQAVADRLQRVSRTSDTVSRLGGDEFLLLCTVDHLAAIEQIAQRLLGVLGAPYRIDGHSFQVTPSIGISVYPRDGTAFEELLRNADAAMYKAKELGRNAFHFFTPNMHAAALERGMLEDALRRALSERQFVLHYQPQFDIATRAVIGVEALIRWQHPKLGLLAPAKFLPIAEETDLIAPLGAWVLREASRQARAWVEAEVLAVPVGVNLSARQLARGDLTESVTRALRDSGLAPGLLEIEITESMLVEDIDNTLETFKELRDLGVKIAIDDFGTGYSNLSCLKRCPLSRLKFDRSLVRELAGEKGDPAIVSAIINVAHSLNLRALAEGVETAEQLRLLQSLGCDEAQGYLLAKPMPAAELEQLLSRASSLALAV